MKTVIRLLDSEYSRTLGNHRVQMNTTWGREFIYHSTVICKTDDVNKTFSVANGGYFTASTGRAISAYRSNLRYTHVEELTLTPIRYKKKRSGGIVLVALDQVGCEYELEEYGLVELGTPYKAINDYGEILFMEELNKVEVLV